MTIPRRLEGVEQTRAARIEAVIASVAARGGPIIIGPWVGEVGFEVLYWVPFVRWAATTFGIQRERLLVVSRGGTAAWYGDFSDEYLDVFSLTSPQQIAAARENAKPKQSAHYDAFLADILERAGRSWEITRFDRLHPHMMYRLFRPYWDGAASLGDIERFLRYTRITPDIGSEHLALPREYVVARLYFSRSFPDTSENREFAQRALMAIAERIPVVVLRNSRTIDDHTDLAISSPDIIDLDAGGDPAANLALQTRVVAGARAFVGTYGGFSYLPAACGVPAVALFSRRRWRACHLRVAELMVAHIDGGQLTPTPVTGSPEQVAALALEHAAR